MSLIRDYATGCGVYLAILLLSKYDIYPLFLLYDYGAGTNSRALSTPRAVGAHQGPTEKRNLTTGGVGASTEKIFFIHAYLQNRSFQ